MRDKLKIPSIELNEHMSILMLRRMLPNLFEFRRKRFCINKIILYLRNQNKKTSCEALLLFQSVAVASIGGKIHVL